MPWVMVPVPEEHLDEVKQRLMFTIARAKGVQGWDIESLRQFLDGADETTRALLLAVARLTLRGEEVSNADAAAAIGRTAAETVTIMRDANDRARESQRPMLMTLDRASEALDEKAVYIRMNQAIAQRLVEAGRTEP